MSNYQFKLVGDMTIKQFFQVAAGVLIAIIAYSSGIHPYIKWPIIVFSFLSGIAFAFFPLQDRPLSKWVFLFVKAIYSPTVFIWKKIEPKPQIFQPESSQKADVNLQTPVIGPTTPLQQVITTQPIDTGSIKLDKTEKEFLTKVSQHFEAQPPSPHPQPQAVQPTPSLTKAEIGKKELMENYQIGPLPTPTKILEIQAAQFSQKAAPPNPPIIANIVVGQVVDSDNKIIETAILEIRDEEGRPKRALKSNQLGHFMIVTPLLDGKYEMITEKDGFVFDNLSFEATGEIIPPIIVQAKKQTSQKQVAQVDQVAQVVAINQ
ncbi:carboxypeptidase-like regulatory domain-containing protein [Patescibacteria group bacterium]|nr:carboxypeptidase-like regulatory domain-containing protein [Patescibacteria group bacterium]